MSSNFTTTATNSTIRSANASKKIVVATKITWQEKEQCKN